VDLLIVMGSSLKVSPVADVKDKIPHHVPQILINMEALPHMSGFDVQLLGYCDVVVTELCRLLGWDLQHEQIPGKSSLAPRTETDGELEEYTDEDGVLHKRPKLPYHQGSQPHRYVFKGGVEHPVYESSVESSDFSSRDSDSEPDSCLFDEEDEQHEEKESTVETVTTRIQEEHHNGHDLKTVEQEKVKVVTHGEQQVTTKESVVVTMEDGTTTKKIEKKETITEMHHSHALPESKDTQDRSSNDF
jgi:hypothetical protein